VRARTRERGVQLLLLLISVGLTLLGFEALLRTFLPQKLYRFPPGLFRNDPDLVFTLTPGFQGKLSNPEYTTHVRINRLGLRGPEVGPKSPGSVRVLGMGDSFVSAFNMEEPETFLSVAAAALRNEISGGDVEIVNAGTPNYGTWHELRLFQRLVPRLSPDAAILCVYVGNDLENNLEPRQAIVKSGLLVERHHSPGILPYPVRAWLQRHAMTYVFLWNAWNQVRPWFGKAEMDPIRSEKELVSPQAPPSVEKGYRISGDMLRQFQEEARSQGIPVLVVIIPAEFQVYPAAFDTILRHQGRDPSRFDLDLPSKRWTELVRDADLPVLDLLPVFRRHREGAYLYMSLDGHLTETGNRLVGESIAQELLPLLHSPPKDRGR
jgi:SGNH hydrolase-like domain, acetyltransferase AlgX